MAYSKKNYTGDGVTKLFTVTFPYIDPTHVTVEINGVSAAFSFQSKYVIEFATAPDAGALIQIKRSSNPEGRLVDFQDDSMGTETVFNLNSDQLLFLAQEAMDNTLEGTVIEQVQDIADAALASALAAASSAEVAQDAASSITFPIPVASGGTGSTTASDARSALGLGTAATKAVGITAGSVVEVQVGGKLPALDASNLTGIKSVFQDITYSLNTVLTGTGTIPWDDTIPQITEGNQILAGTITPSSVGNKIVVELNISVGCATSANGGVGLFQDGAASAVKVAASTVTAAYIQNALLRYEFTATAVTPITFTVRAGLDAGTLTVNGAQASRKYGGALSSYMRIMEVKP